MELVTDATKMKERLVVVDARIITLDGMIKSLDEQINYLANASITFQFQSVVESDDRNEIDRAKEDVRYGRNKLNLLRNKYKSEKKDLERKIKSVENQ